MNYSYISHSSFPLKKSDLISQNLEVISGILQENRLWKYVQINSLSRLDKLDSLVRLFLTKKFNFPELTRLTVFIMAQISNLIWFF